MRHLRLDAQKLERKARVVVGKILFRSVHLVLPYGHFNVGRNQSNDHADFSVFQLSNVKDICNVPKDVVELRSHSEMLGSSLYSTSCYKCVTSQKTQKKDSNKNFPGSNVLIAS